MVKVPLKMGQELVRAMAQQGESAETKTRVLFVDEEMYGPLEFPKSFILGRGQLLKLAAYGKLQVTVATVDTLHCTKEINEELYNEYKRNPPTSDVDFSNDSVAGGISPSISRSIPFPALGMGQAHRKPNFDRVKHPNPGNDSGGGTPTRFL